MIRKIERIYCFKSVINYPSQNIEKKKSESLQTEGRHFRSMICKINDV